MRCGLAIVVALVVSCAASAAAPREVRLGDTAPRQLAVTDDGSLWIVSDGPGVLRRGPTGKITRVKAGDDTIVDLTAGPDGAIWFAGYNAVGRIDANGTVRRWMADSAESIAPSDDALWFTSAGAPGHVVRLATDGSMRSFALPVPRRTFGMPGIAAGPDGSAWFTLQGYGHQAADAIGHVTSAGHVTAYPLHLPRAEPNRIVAGADGALWFTEQNASAIGRITTTGRITEFPLRTGLRPDDIAAGEDGALWFTADGCLGRITTSGRSSAWPVRGAGRLLGLAAAQDGSFWIADDIADALWHVTPGSGSSACSPPSVTRDAGPVRATLVYHRDVGLTWYVNPTLRISRGGRRLLDARVPVGSGALPGDPVYGDTSTFMLRDLDGDGEPEVLVDLNSGGAHCCSWTRVYRYVPARRRYAAVTHFWGNAGSDADIRDLNGDRRPEFLSTDDRFTYVFDSYAASVPPIRIWSYRHGSFVDVTRNFPRLIRHDAAFAWSLYVKYRGRESVRGILPAWAADEVMLGRGATVWPALEEARRSGNLDRPPCDRYDPCGESYVKAVRALLRKLGYLG